MTWRAVPPRASSPESQFEKGFPHVAVRPDGGITVTYINFDSQRPEVWYVRCTPNAASPPLSCAPPTLVHVEPQPLLGRLAAQSFRLLTRPQHAHRVDANGTETYGIWDRCKVALLDPSGQDTCPDGDVVMKASRDNGATWSALTCVSCAVNDQFSPTVRADRSRNIVNIALYSSGNDTTFQHRLRVLVYHINPGTATPDPPEPHTITTLLNDPSGDPFGAGFGSGIGVAARGTGADGQSRAYVHYTYHNIQGTYSGVQAPEPNNHLSRLDY